MTIGKPVVEEKKYMGQAEADKLWPVVHQYASDVMVSEPALSGVEGPKGEHRRPEILEDVDRTHVHALGNGLREGDAITFDNEVDVLARATDEHVAHITTDGERGNVLERRFSRYRLKERLLHNTVQAGGIHGLC